MTDVRHHPHKPGLQFSGDDLKDDGPDVVMGMAALAILRQLEQIENDGTRP